MKGAIAMFAVTWKYTSKEEIMVSGMTSREVWFLRLDPCVEVLKVEEI